MSIHKKKLLIIFLLCSFTTKEQILGPNLVNNPSFEEFYSCPQGSAELNLSKYWWGYSSDYYNACSPSSIYGVSVPMNGAGFQYAHTGNAYSGCSIYNRQIISLPDYRETIKTKLSDTLIVNKRYCTNFYVSLANGSYESQFSYYVLLDSIGMLFTKDPVLDSLTPILSNGVKVQNDILNLDTVNWLKTTNTFKANGGELYLAIGNFDNVIIWPIGKTGATYVLIDDVSVCECSFNFNLGNDTTLCTGQTLQLKVSMPNATYTWQDGSTDSIYTVTHAGTYWVRAYFADYNITTTDTINITYKDCEDTLIIPNIFTPNGDGVNDYFVVKNSNNWNINLQVFNRWGVKVYEDDNYKNNWDGKYKGNPLADGTYFYIIKAKGKDTGKEKEYNGSLMIMR